MPPLTRHCYDVVVKAGGQTKGLKALGMLKDGDRHAEAAEGSGTRRTCCRASSRRPPTSMTCGLPTRRAARATAPAPTPSPGSTTACSGHSPTSTRRRRCSSSPATRSTPTTSAAVLLPMLSELGKDIVGHGAAARRRCEPRGVVRALPRAAAPERRPQARAVHDTDGDNHLLTYGEFVAMYCAAFSPAVWRPLKNPDQLFAAPPERRRPDVRHGLGVGVRRGHESLEDGGRTRRTAATSTRSPTRRSSSRPGATRCPGSRGRWPTCRPT